MTNRGRGCSVLEYGLTMDEYLVPQNYSTRIGFQLTLLGCRLLVMAALAASIPVTPSSAAYATTYAIIVPSEPIIIEQSTPFTQLEAGRQVIVATIVQSNVNDTRDYVTIIEVRNPIGFAEMLSWQSGKIAPHDANQVGVSWIPLEGGTYEIRTFVLSSLENPKVYSPIATSEIDVVDR